MKEEVEISTYINVRDRALELGCVVPDGIALLPRNFENAQNKGELLNESNTSTVRILWREAGIIETRLESDQERFPEISEKGFVEWIAPTIFVTSAWLSQNPEVMAVALGVISNYLTDIFKGRAQAPNVRLTIIVDSKNGEYRKVTYKGPVEGLSHISSVLRKLIRND